VLPATGARPRAWLAAALLPAGVLVVDPQGYAPFGPLRWAVVSVVGLLTVAVAGRGVRHVTRWPAVAWTLFVAWVGVCAALGVDPVYAWIGTAERHFGALTWVLCGVLFVAGHALDDDADARLVTGAALVATGAAGAWAVAQELGWQPVHLAGASRLTGSLRRRGRPPGPRCGVVLERRTDVAHRPAADGHGDLVGHDRGRGRGGQRRQRRQGHGRRRRQ